MVVGLIVMGFYFLLESIRPCVVPNKRPFVFSTSHGDD